MEGKDEKTKQNFINGTINYNANLYYRSLPSFRGGGSDNSIDGALEIAEGADKEKTLDLADIDENISDAEKNIEDMNSLYDDSGSFGVVEEKKDIKAKAITFEDFEYTLSSGKATITKYTGSETELVIPSTIDGHAVIRIGKKAFSNNVLLRSITMPNSVTSIGESAFLYCCSLRNIVIPNNIINIEKGAFYGCKSLTNITIPNNIKSIKDYVFCSCESLTSITIPNSVKSIGNYAFCGCEALTDIIIPRNVTSIGAYAFSGCSPSLLAKVYKNTAAEKYCLKGKISYKYLDVFAQAVKLNVRSKQIRVKKSFVIKATVRPINTTNKKLKWTSSNKKVATVNSNGKVTGKKVGKAIITARTTDGSNKSAKATVRVIPLKAKSKKVAAGKSFRINSNLKLINKTNVNNEIKSDLQNFDTNIDENISDVEKNIKDMDSLYDDSGSFGVVEEKKDIKAKTMTSGYYEYYVSGGTAIITEYTGSATSINIPSTIDGYVVTGIESGVYYTSIFGDGYDDNNQVRSITIPNSVTWIGEYTFYECVNLTNLTLSSNLKSIGESAFENCSSLTNLRLPDSVTNIGFSAFGYCNSLRSITLSNSLKNIGEYAFSWCSSFTNLVIPDSVTSIGEGAFWGCDSLINVTIPSNVRSIGDNAFSGCHPSLLVKVYKNTPAEKYCLQNDILCEYLDVFAQFVELDVSLKQIKAKESFIIKATVSPSNTTNKTVRWTSSNKNIATVNSSGKVTGKKPGKAIITARTADGSNKTAKATVRVIPVKIKSIKLNVKSRRVAVGKSFKIKATIRPSNATNKNLKWRSSNKKVATVTASGKVIPKKVGKTVITATAKDGSKRKARITIRVVVGKVKKLSWFREGGEYYDGIWYNSRYYMKISKTKGAKKYEIYRSNDGYSFRKIATTRKTRYEIPSKYYYYKVRAVNGKVKGKFSKVYRL